MEIKKGETTPFDGVLLTKKEYHALLRDKRIVDQFEIIVRDK